LKKVLLKYGRFLLKHPEYSCVLTQTAIQQLLNAWTRVLTTAFPGGFVADNVTREWLLTSNEIFPCQLPICEFSISIRLSDYRLQMMMMIMAQQDIKELHKTVTPCTANILREVLM
jgi:hypothetical protein